MKLESAFPTISIQDTRVFCVILQNNNLLTDMCYNNFGNVWNLLQASQINPVPPHTAQYQIFISF